MVEVRGLEATLRERVSAEVRFDAGTRALYGTGGSNYRQIPLGAVVPRSIDDVVATVATCREFGAPILPLGGDTSLAGQSVNVAVVVDFSKKLRTIHDVDADGRIARVQPGVVRDQLDKAARTHGLTFAPDPSTHAYCTLGGMLGNNSCGTHSVMGGKTDDNTIELEVLTYDGLRMRVGPTPDDELERIIGDGGRRGEIYAKLRDLRDRYATLIRERYPNIPRRVSGYNLNWLLPENGFDVAKALVGSEGTCVTILEATVRLLPNPEKRTVVVLGFPDVYEAATAVPDVMSHEPIACEGMDDVLADNMRKKGLHANYLDLLPDGKAWLMVEFGADTQEVADDRARNFVHAMTRGLHAPSCEIYDDPEVEERVWEIRESGLGATARVPGEPDTWEGWEDSAAPPERLADYLRDLRKLYDEYGYHGALYGHFGQGCIHTRINFDLTTAPGVRKFRQFVREASELVVSYGGSLSGEHGDGQSRAEFLEIMFGPELVQAFREFKAIWDPDGRMNPRKVVDPPRVDDNLRLGAGYQAKKLETHFAYPNDDGSLERATLRCVGVGKCRRVDGGLMCPSYQVTKEEKHSTRGRAHLLWEMLQGRELDRGWKQDAVLEALDLCLACKGCKGECPVNVDMATYKAEFLSHYYKGRLRPRAAYSMGLMYWHARAASKVPTFANFALTKPGISTALKRLAGVATDRPAPEFARTTFRDWFERRTPRNVGRPKVLLWPDTWNNHFHPAIAAAAAEVLEAAGFRVVIPEVSLCCGRPLFDFGMLSLAKRLLRRTLHALHDEIEAGTPVVALEPSCASVFRDELRELLPNDDEATRLSENTFLFAEFVRRRARDVRFANLGRTALVQGHCHQRAVMGMTEERELMDQLGLDVRMPDSGCCGMAGSFGFEKEKFDVSMQIGERVLLPHVREAADDTLVVADGFSCREQILHGTGRRALHVAQLARMALRNGDRSTLAASSGK